uniref:Protein kinase domain-containing protein n=1 Tax=Peronospora matthiolae TaxID=2874970 RepID=A0AAV1U005_9STRA
MAPSIVTSQHARKSSTRCSCDSDRELDDKGTGVQVPSEELAQLSIDTMEMSKFQAGTTAVSKADVVANIESRSEDQEDSKDAKALASANILACLGSRNDIEKCATRPRQRHCSGKDSSTTRLSFDPLLVTGVDSSTRAPTEALSPAGPAVLPKVITRKGDKSSLDFHQRYTVTKHLGQGSYSTVEQVTRRAKGGVYACKIVDKSSLSAADRTALSHEVRVLSSVNHVNIMRLYEVIQDDVKCYMVTELADGGDLFDRIVKQGKFPEREAQKVTAALVEALLYCHTHNIIHRDVKPENVLFLNDDVKLGDFGFARQLAHSEEQVSDSCGTPGYAAPEILDGQPYGLEADVFSLGVVMYVMLCGYPPFPMKLVHLRKHRFNVKYPVKDWASIHPDVKTLVSKMLDADPRARPSMALLQTHPWIQAGKEASKRTRQEDRERCHLADLTQRQRTASAIRKQLVRNGFKVVKYGRNGLPHRTKLRLSGDGQVLSWQPKLLKRGLLRYHNARSFTNLFPSRDKRTSQPDQQPSESQVNRVVPTGGVAGRSTVKHKSEQRALAASTDSSIGSTSDAIREKRLWWRLLCRERNVKTERTASGVPTPNFSFRETSSTPSSPIRRSEAKVPQMQSPSSILKSIATPTTGSSDRCLDNSINLHDVREILSGDGAPFSAGRGLTLPNSFKRTVNPACVLSVYTRFRELHLEFLDERVRDGFEYLLQQATLPLQHCVASQPAQTSSTPSLPPAPHKPHDE